MIVIYLIQRALKQKGTSVEEGERGSLFSHVAVNVFIKDSCL